MLSQPELWTRIETFDLDGRGTSLFAQRVQRQLKLSSLQTELAILEYRRYLYLAESSVVQTHPSPQLLTLLKCHLGLPETAWDRFLAEIARDATHYKDITAAKDNLLARNAYLQTRALYRTEFEEDPPQKFWPDLPPIPPQDSADPQRRRVYEILALLGLILALALSGLALYAGAYTTLWQIGLPVLVISLHFMYRAGRLQSRMFRVFNPRNRNLF